MSVASPFTQTHENADTQFASLSFPLNGPFFSPLAQGVFTSLHCKRLVLQVDESVASPLCRRHGNLVERARSMLNFSQKNAACFRLCVFSCTAESSFAPLSFSPASTLFFPGGRRQKLPVRFCSVLRHFGTFSTFNIKTSFELVLSRKTANKTHSFVLK